MCITRVYPSDTIVLRVIQIDFLILLRVILVVDFVAQSGYNYFRCFSISKTSGARKRGLKISWKINSI